MEPVKSRVYAFGSNAERLEDGVIHGSGTACELYKNWLYVRDPKGWVEGRGWVSPYVAKINEGVIAVADFDIVAARGPQDSIFVTVITSTGCRMAGISCLGHIDSVGIVADEEDLHPEEWIFNAHVYDPDDEGFVTFEFVRRQPAYADSTTLKCRRREDEYGIQHVGILPETVTDFVQWLKDSREYRSDEDHACWVDRVAANTVG